MPNIAMLDPETVHCAVLTLDQLPDRQWATVVDMARPASAEERTLALRLTEIGFVPRAMVQVMARGALGGDPLAVRVGHSTFALRRHEAALVQVMPRLEARRGWRGRRHSRGDRA
jgi:ferrous iron transport protein A